MTSDVVAEAIEGVAEHQFRYLFNEQTGRWDVLWRRPDGTETVVGAYSTPAEAMEIVAHGNEEPPEPPTSK